MTDFTEHTQAHIETLALEDRKALGQYMTPNFIGRQMAGLFTFPEKSSNKVSKVLDPSAGTGELLRAFGEEFPEKEFEFHAWDRDANMLKVAQKNVVNLQVANYSLFDTISTKDENSFDFIIGNPPYFKIDKESPEVKNIGFKTAEEKGQINIYGLFFEYALKLLKEGGELVFLVPPSMNNGAYFSILRSYILEHSYIKTLKAVQGNGHFAEALTHVQIVHLVKSSKGIAYNLKKSESNIVDFNMLNPSAGGDLPVLFTSDKETIVKAWDEHKSLSELGFVVSTGKIVWNRVKDSFVREKTPVVKAPLLYSKDISTKNKLSLNSDLDERRWLTDSTPGMQSGEKIIVNRISRGATTHYLRYALVSLPFYFTENHVNVIEATDKAKISMQDLEKRIAKATKDWLPEYLQALTGNAQLGAKELQHLVPF